MNRWYFLLLFLCVQGIFLSIFGFSYKPSSSIVPSPTPIPQSLPSSLRLEEKVGQLFIVGIDGTTVENKTRDFILSNHIGGIILYSKNITSEEQLEKLIADLQEISPIPLFISIDQEGAPVTRIHFDNTYEVTSQAAIRSLEEAYQIAYRRGTQLKKFGITMNYSPVLDISENKDSFIYDRIFFQPYDQVGLYSGAMIEGYKKAGVIGVAKHFPGHSDAVIDPHKKVPQIEKERSEIPLKPFQHLIEYASPEILMVGHILYPKIDAKNLTSLSPIFIQDILRKELKYTGLVISDDMEMGAITTSYTPEEAAVKAILAGTDMLLYSSAGITSQTAISAVIQAVQEGQIKESDLDKKVIKIQSLKEKYK